MKKNLQKHKFYIFTTNERITVDEIFIRKFVSQIDELHVNTVHGINNIEKLTNALCSSNVKVSFVI